MLNNLCFSKHFSVWLKVVGMKNVHVTAGNIFKNEVKLQFYKMLAFQNRNLCG